jgi:hypothetical protein
MTTRTDQISPQTVARTAGLLYLLLLPLGIFGMAVSANLVVAGDAAATARTILTSESLFRLSIVSALAVQVVNVLVVLLLYKLLESVNRSMAALMVIFLLLGAPIAMLNELNQFAVLFLLSGAHSAADPSQALVPLFLNLHALGIQIAGIYWGLWLFPMGYLVFKSGFLPRILGVLLIIGCLGYLVDSFAAFLAPGLHVQVAQFTFLGEVLLPLWLLVKGVNVERWGRLVLATA